MGTPLYEVPCESGEVVSALRRLDPQARASAFLDLPPGRSAADLGRGLRLLLVGAGSVGTAAGLALAGLRPEAVIVVDPARFKLESTLTHAGVGADDVGRSKAAALGRRIKAASPNTRVLVFEGPFEELPIGIAAHAGVWGLGSDNLRVELRVTAAALQLGRPLLQASVYPPALVAQVRSLASHPDGNGPCLACGLSEHEWQQADAGTRFSCTGPPESERAWAPSQVPTRSVAPLCAVAGSLLALEVIRQRLGIAAPGESHLIELRGYGLATTTTPLRRRPDCPLDHAPARLLPEHEPLGRRTPRELLERAGYAGETELHRVTLSVARRRFAKLSRCRCPAHDVLERFVTLDGSAGRCPRCQEERVPHAFFSSDEVPFAAFGARLDRSLASLGAHAPDSARVRGDRGTSLVYRALPETGIPQELRR